jgi:hypothetical protein
MPMAARSPKTSSWFMPPTLDPAGTIVVHLTREAAHPGSGAPWLAGAWIAGCSVGNQPYSARSHTGPVHALAQRLFDLGVPDAPMVVHTPGEGESRHESFHALIGKAATPKAAPAPPAPAGRR